MVLVDGLLEEQCAAHLNESDHGSLRVHSIETFGTHDGPGIRLVVFLQGCQFRCLYCANPDTMDVKGGTLVSIDELVEKAIAQKPYFGTKGGVTISGGEPLLQRSKLKVLFRLLHEHGIRTALDTNGKLLNHDVEELLQETDLVLLDVKHINNRWHHKITGVGNEGTLKVAAHREASGKKMWIRYVLVPGWSDQEEFLHELGKHFAGYKSIERFQILPYHKLGVHKWKMLGMEYKLAGIEPPSEEEINSAVKIFRQYFSNVAIG